MAAGRIAVASAAEDDGDTVGPYFLLEREAGTSGSSDLDDGGGDGDSSRLSQLGYKQELGRRLS